MIRQSLRLGSALGLAMCLATGAAGQLIPHGQNKPPGPALTPEQALAKMEVPEGFQVELVAAEPDVINPVSMTFDASGRIWITESFEYPRQSPGEGRDRIKILEDTDRDGRVDKVSVFAEGLNIPSGIAVGYGGVWVANAPDILFLQDTDGDGRADRSEVVVTGFGRDDTHELPNSLTWGPDGYLYGLNGVFNHSHVKHKGREYRFTCALFRIHPRTRDFEVFAEGTSNPWGIAWNPRGDAFLSACVIDHLWHITETGYYHRQGGPYPPFTWKIDSIVKHKHQQAAYCGIHYYDSDAYPPEYRDRLYMGNIHGNCINVDVLSDDGASYFARPAADFLTANDAWFMPVAQKTGPDGCLYVLDWYDRYHCYQDARRDPRGIDRGSGRLYRIRYDNSPRAEPFNLASETDQQLIKRLHSPNVFYRDIAQRLLTERNHAATRPQLQSLVLDTTALKKTRLHALWSLVGAGNLDEDFHLRLLDDADEDLRAWAVRAAGNSGTVVPSIRQRVSALVDDPSPRVKLQVAIAARKVDPADAIPLLLGVLANAGDDTLIPHIVWQNLHPLLETGGQHLLQLAASAPPENARNLNALMPRILDRLLAVDDLPAASVAQLLTMLGQGPLADSDTARACVSVLIDRVQSGELAGERGEELRHQLAPLMTDVFADPEHPLATEVALLGTTWRDGQAMAAVRQMFLSTGRPAEDRARALDALIAAEDAKVVEMALRVIREPVAHPFSLRESAVAGLAELDAPHVGASLIEVYPLLEPELQPHVIEALTGRPIWSRKLLDAIAAAKVPASALNANHVRKLLDAGDAELASLVREKWGTLRTQRDPAREQLIAEMRKVLVARPGDPHAGQVVYRKVCGQCHKMFGEGDDVGPDITTNGRSSFEQLLSNVFDPSLVIGAGYQATTIVTEDGRILTGLVAEDNPERVVLKTQGGKIETIAREDVEQQKLSELSLMPEGFEKQLTEEELVDLFAFLTLDRPPTDPAARRLAGTARIVEEEASTDPADFARLISQVLPGWSSQRCGEGGIALLAEHLGQSAVIRTHPVDRRAPCILRRTVTVPARGRTRLSLSVSHDPRGDWRLVVLANGEKLHESLIDASATQDGWRDIPVDLTRFAGQQVNLELHNAANDWNWEFGYWRRAELVVQEE